ncbi:MAG: tetratricopeptide repeat protein, partial [Nevskiales bacterium]
TARPIFKRVSLTGPYSNMALLGLGWTELVPDGEVQTVKFQRSLRCADARNPPEGTYLLLFSSYRSCKSDRKASRFTYYRRFAFEADGATGEKRYRDALRPLLELSQREIQDPAVQEALLAVGYLYGQLGSSRAAIRAYQRAISLYESEIAALDGLLAKVANPETDLQDLTDNTDFMRETPALGSSRPYARITFDLESIRRSVEEHRATASWIERQIPSTERRRQLVSHVRTEWEIQNQAIAQTRSSLNSALREKTRTELVLKRERLIQYLAHARLAAARIYDEQRPPRS